MRLQVWVLDGDSKSHAGILAGAGKGALEASRTDPALPASGSARLRLNRLLNLSGRSGRVAGNAMGILGLFFSTSESGLGYLSDGQTPDWLNTLGAGRLLLCTTLTGVSKTLISYC